MPEDCQIPPPPLQDRSQLRVNPMTCSGHFQPLPFAMYGTQKIACSERCSLCRALLASQRQWPSWRRHRKAIPSSCCHLGNFLPLTSFVFLPGVWHLSKGLPNLFSPSWLNAHARFPLGCFALRVLYPSKDLGLG